MTDITKIDRPFGLLDEATQKALRECGGPWEIYNGDGWERIPDPSFFGRLTYRQKPQPPKPEEFWLVRNSVYDPFSVLKGEPPKGYWKHTIHVQQVIE